MKKFKVEFILDGNGLSVKSENDGFGSFELLGLLNWKVSDIGKQIVGEIKPDIIERRLITDTPKQKESEQPKPPAKKRK